MILPPVHGPSVRRRARADAGALLLTVVVLALSTMLISAVPPLAEQAADRAVADAVTEAGTAGTVVVTASLEEGAEPRVRNPRAVAGVSQDVALARFQLPARLADVLRPPVASLTSSELQVLGGGPGRYLRLAYVTDPDGPPQVGWTAGSPPAASVGPADAAVTLPSDAPPWPVQVGLSQAAATALGVQVGDRLSTQDAQRRPVDVRVSGIFTATDPSDGAWQASPQLLQPVEGVEAQSARASATALVTDASLPDLELAVPSDNLLRRVAFAPEPAAMRWREAPALTQAVAALKSTSSGGVGRSPRRWDTLLDAVLSRARDDVLAARAQAAVLVVGLLVATSLVLLLTALLLVRRRAAQLVSARERGAGLVTVASELLLESVAVAAVGTGAGLLVTRALVGSPSWTWPLPAVVVAVLAVPVVGVLATARATAGRRRPPANRADRQRIQRTERWRRGAGEGALVLAAAAGLLALVQRGVVPPGTDGGTDLLAVGAPTLAVVAGAVVLRRTVPVVAGFVLARFRRSVHGTRFLAVVRFAAAAPRVLPFLVVAVVVAQLTVALAMAATVQRGQADQAWQVVGGDARLTTGPSAQVAALADRVATAPGVTAALAARVEDGVRVRSAQTSDQVRLVVVDADAFQLLLADTPLGPVPRLQRLGDAGRARVPALLSGGEPELRPGLQLFWQDEPVPLDVVGTAPQVGTGPAPVLVVDATAFAAVGATADPDTVWAVGPGAPDALEALAAPTDTVELRSNVLSARRDAPLPGSLRRLATTAALALFTLGALGVVLAAAVASPDRLQFLTRLRTLGLRRRDLRTVVAGELVPPVVVAALVGLLLGAACALVTFAPLELNLLTGQQRPPVVVIPWWAVAAVLPFVAAALGATVSESSPRRHRSLGQLLRSGGR